MAVPKPPRKPLIPPLDLFKRAPPKEPPPLNLEGPPRISAATGGPMTARVYHGTALPDHQLFDQFDPRVNSSHLKPSDKVDAVWLTSEPRLGGRYAQSAAQDFTESYAFKRAAADPEFQRLEQAQRDAYENIYKGKVPPFGGNKLRKMEDEKLAIIDRYRKEAKGAGAVVIPADVSFQRPRVVDGARVFSPQVYAKELEAAAKAGNDGVVFRQVVDTPSGVGEPADVFAAIKPNTVYSAIDGSRLYGGAAAAGAVGAGAGALALQPEDAEAAPLGAIKRAIEAERLAAAQAARPLMRAADGAPLNARAYHGTALPDGKMFDQFDPSMSGAHYQVPSGGGQAVWATSNPHNAGIYSITAGEDFTEALAKKAYQADPEYAKAVAYRDAIAKNLFASKAEKNAAAKRVYQIRDKHRADSKYQGSTIVPLDVRFGNPRVVDKAIGFDPKIWADEVRQGVDAGNDGVVFRNVIDSPTGIGQPADVYAALKRGTLFSAVDGSRLYGGAAAAGAVGAGALALQPEDAEAAPRMTPEEAYASQIAADRQEFFSQPGPMLARAAAETFDPTGFGIAASNNLRDQGLTVAQIIPRLPMEYGRLAGDTAKSFLGYIDPEYRARAGTSDFAADFRPLGEAVRTAGDWIDSKLTGRPMQTYRKAPPMAAPVMR